MKEFIDKLIERLGKLRHDNPMITRNYILRNDAISIVNELAEEYKTSYMDELVEARRNCSEDRDCSQCIFGQVKDRCYLAELQIDADIKYNNGWIPCSERLPEKLEPVNVTWVNRKPESYYAHIKDIPFVATAFYHNGKWWWYSCVCEDYLSEYGKSECDAVDKDIDIIAWQPLPTPYQQKEGE